MKNRPKHPDSKDPTIAELNKLVYQTFPPKWDRRMKCWTYGKLYFLSEGIFFMHEPTWMLDGMTPVGIDSVLGVLRRHGVDVKKFLPALEALNKQLDCRRRVFEFKVDDRYIAEILKKPNSLQIGHIGPMSQPKTCAFSPLVANMLRAIANSIHSE
jgi:hypothetical protein